MRKLVLPILVLSILSFPFFKKTVKIRAQTLPVTRTAVWDANPVSENVTNYTVTLDGVVVGNPTSTSQSVVFTTAGAHVLTLTATNLWGTSPITTLNINVIVPTSPKNIKIQ